MDYESDLGKFFRISHTEKISIMGNRIKAFVQIITNRSQNLAASTRGIYSRPSMSTWFVIPNSIRYLYRMEYINAPPRWDWRAGR